MTCLSMYSSRSSGRPTHDEPPLPGPDTSDMAQGTRCVSTGWRVVEICEASSDPRCLSLVLVPECQELHVPPVEASRVSSSAGRSQAVLGCSVSLGALNALHKRYRQGVAHSERCAPPPVNRVAIDMYSTLRPCLSFLPQLQPLWHSDQIDVFSDLLSYHRFSLQLKETGRRSSTFAVKDFPPLVSTPVFVASSHQ